MRVTSVPGWVFASLTVLAFWLPGSGAAAESSAAAPPVFGEHLEVGDGEVLEIGPGEELRHTGPLSVSGTGQVLVSGSFYLNGSLNVADDGVISVNGGTFRLEGKDTHITLSGNAALAIVNGATLHFVQDYVHQHAIYAHDDANVFLFQAQVNSDGSAETVVLRGNAAYTAIATNFQDWTTWYMWDNSKLTLNAVQKAGDIVYYDNPTIDIKNTVGVMPWMHFPDGAVADLSLPDTRDCQPTSLSIDSSVVSGIGWSLSIENSSCVALGISSYPGSDITVRDTYLAMAMIRLTGDDLYYLPGDFKNGEFHEDFTVASLPDRNLRLVNSSVDWWKVDAHESADVIAHDLAFSEMMVIDDARMWITDSVCEGQTIHLGALDNAAVYFKRGEVWSYVSTWDKATMVLEDSLLDHTQAEYLYQYTNIAHQQSRLYAINTEFVSPEDDPRGALPQALDSALVMYVRLPDLAASPWASWIPIRGEAWIDQGLFNPTRFKRYTLSARRKGGLIWRQFGQGVLPAPDERILGWFVPSLLGLPRGEYEIALTVEVTGDDPLTAWPTDDFPAVKEILVY